MDKATFAAGCFWGVEAAYRRIPGVTTTRVGYSGGDEANPSYESVCTGLSGHAEAVEVAYDDLLEVFWAVHDPTQANRQGPDVGSQYRSAIFTHDPQQEDVARASLARLAAAKTFPGEIVTEIAPAGLFHLAEDYHQQYLEKRGRRAGRLF
jgi:peptide-methionine (S)-S-oxide reductase